MAAMEKPMADKPAAGGADPALAIIQKRICWTCHVIPGVPNAVAKVGPSLAGFAGRPKIAGVLDNNEANLAKWLANPPAVKKGTQMPPLGLSQDEISALVKFLGTLK